MQTQSFSFHTVLSNGLTSTLISASSPLHLLYCNPTASITVFLQPPNEKCIQNNQALPGLAQWHLLGQFLNTSEDNTLTKRKTGPLIIKKFSKFLIYTLHIYYIKSQHRVSIPIQFNLNTFPSLQKVLYCVKTKLLG